MGPAAACAGAPPVANAGAACTDVRTHRTRETAPGRVDALSPASNPARLISSDAPVQRCFRVKARKIHLVSSSREHSILSGRRVSSHFLSHDGTTAEANRRRAVVPRPECRHSYHGLCDCRPISARQSNCEFSELADPAVDRDRAAVLLGDDVPGNRQAESGAFAGRLISRNCPRFRNLRCVRVALRAPVDLDLCAGLERAFGDVQTP
jgi:hypothetical protein